MDKIIKFLGKVDKQVLVYFTIFGILAIAVLFNAREIIMTPWTAREWISTAVDNENVYIPGGLDIHNEYNDKILHIDLKERTIKTIGVLPTARYSTAAVYKEPYVYIAGGYDIDGYLNEIVRYDPDEEISEIILHFEEKRCYGSLINNSGTLYYIGGFNGTKAVDTILKIDTETGNISQTATLKYPVNFHSAISVNGNIIVIGGENGEGNKVTDIYELNPETGEILREGFLPLSLIRTTAAVSDNKLYVMGGWGEGGARDEIIRIDLDKSSLNGEIIGYMPQKSSDKSLVSFNSDLFYIGGMEKRYMRQMNVINYNRETNTNNFVKLKSYPWWH